jgi:molybdate transport system ATP-binding protein
MIEIAIKKLLLANEDEFQLDCNLSIESGEFIAVYGDSGAGKSSLLRMISGLLVPDSGKITVDQKTYYDAKNNIHLRPQDREIGFVFQDAALFPNMSVRGNIEYAIPKEVNKNWAMELIKMIDLKSLQDRSVETLSGGQKQRVSLARALAKKPRILLLDEALSALDHSTRNELQDYISSLHRSLGLTSIMVSHDIAEISKMADRLIMMESGKITTEGDVFSIFTNKQISGKFQFNGEILAIVPSDVIFIVSVLIGKNLVKVVVDEKTVIGLAVGDRVVVVSKAFNPILLKIRP